VWRPNPKLKPYDLYVDDGLHPPGLSLFGVEK
jgi:hypothetical protein